MNVNKFQVQQPGSKVTYVKCESPDTWPLTTQYYILQYIISKIFEKAKK